MRTPVNLSSKNCNSVWLIDSSRKIRNHHTLCPYLIDYHSEYWIIWPLVIFFFIVSSTFRKINDFYSIIALHKNQHVPKRTASNQRIIFESTLDQNPVHGTTSLPKINHLVRISLATSIISTQKLVSAQIKGTNFPSRKKILQWAW